jgi:hypothetical protein
MSVAMLAFVHALSDLVHSIQQRSSDMQVVTNHLEVITRSISNALLVQNLNALIGVPVSE